jgi:hypothetical protein
MEINLEFWRKRKIYTLLEIAYLTYGMEPEAGIERENPTGRLPHERFLEPSMPSGVRNLFEVLVGLIESNKLKPFCDNDGTAMMLKYPEYLPGEIPLSALIIKAYREDKVGLLTVSDTLAVERQELQRLFQKRKGGLFEFLKDPPDIRKEAQRKQKEEAEGKIIEQWLSAVMTWINAEQVEPSNVTKDAVRDVLWAENITKSEAILREVWKRIPADMKNVSGRPRQAV